MIVKKEAKKVIRHYKDQIKSLKNALKLAKKSYNGEVLVGGKYATVSDLESAIEECSVSLKSWKVFVKSGADTENLKGSLVLGGHL
jgi:exopolysaccharide biosynthesis protein